MSTTHDAAPFERERDKLVAEIAEVSSSPPGICVLKLTSPPLPPPPWASQNLGKCVTAVNQLNRNIEDVTSVDGGFSAVYSTWSRFQRALETGSYADSVRLSPSFFFPRAGR